VPPPPFYNCAFPAPNVGLFPTFEKATIAYIKYEKNSLPTLHFHIISYALPRLYLSGRPTVSEERLSNPAFPLQAGTESPAHIAPYLCEKIRSLLFLTCSSDLWCFKKTLLY